MVAQLHYGMVRQENRRMTVDSRLTSPFYSGTLPVFCFCVKTLYASQCRFCVSFVTLSGPYKKRKNMHAGNLKSEKQKIRNKKTETENPKRKNRKIKNRRENQNPKTEKSGIRKNGSEKQRSKNSREKIRIQIRNRKPEQRKYEGTRTKQKRIERHA